jgi:hypothetical protein
VTKGIVRFALRRGASEGSEDAAFRALAGVDPLVRWRAARSVRAFVARAEQATTVNDAAHHARLAALMAEKGVPDAGFDDVEAVARELEAVAPPEPPRRGPWLVGGTAVLVVIAAVVIIVVWIVTRPFDPSKTAAGHLLAGPMEDFVVAADRVPADTGALSEARGAAEGRSAKRARGGAAATALGKLLDSTAALGRASIGKYEPARDAFFAAAASFDDRLAEAKLPYFVDADLLPRPGLPAPLLFSFYIERDKLVEAGKQRVRVVDVWRLDRLNVWQNLLGYTRARTPAALVLFDQLETELVRSALPAIPPGEYAAIVDDSTRILRPDWVKPIEAHAGEVIRRHYALLPPAERADAERIGKLLARRRALIEKWQPELRGQGLELHVPDRLIPEAHYSRDLDLRVPRDELREWDAIHEALLEPENLRAFVRLRDHYVASVERHEVQHRLDYARGLVPVPPVLVKMLGVDNPLAAPEGSLPARARDELSAYLAELAASPDSPLLQLMLLSRFVLDVDLARANPPYFYAAFAAYQGIGEELGLEVDALLSHGGPFRERFVPLVFAVVDKSPQAIRAAAARCYEKQFGHAVEVVKTVSQSDHPTWRH